MRIGVLELLNMPVRGLWGRVEANVVRRQFVGVISQAVSVWCRQMGHEVFYVPYLGIGKPEAALPKDLDVLFIAAHTYLAPFAYALSKIYRDRGTRTVLGGAHAKAFPADSRRFFDVIVLDCNRDLIAAILNDEFEPHSIVSTENGLGALPSLEERMPEIRRSVFWGGRPYPGTLVPMLSSVGCPYNCNFCVDWNSKYHALSVAQLETDLQYAAENYQIFRHTKLSFHDPNFAIRFDETLTAFERIPKDRRVPYGFECSLTVLKPERLPRLKDTNCIVATPGIESWMQYSHKAAAGSLTRDEKLVRVVAHFHELKDFIPYLGANFIFGLDTDFGDEPFELTKEFIRQVPFVWLSMNIPIAFGGTPLYNEFLRDGRLLKSMPFTFYTIPYLTVILKNYDPVEYLEKLIDLYSLATSLEIVRKRNAYSTNWLVSAINNVRTLRARQWKQELQRMHQYLLNDAQMLAFHRGHSEKLPAFYVQAYRQQMGAYAAVIPLETSRPQHDPAPVAPTLFA